MVGALGGLRDHEPRHRAGIRVGELLREVGEQALRDELEQHVVVALERHVDVEVLAESDHAVLREEAGAAARLARLLQRLERVPGGQGLERGGDRLQVLAVVVGVGLAGEDRVELHEELVVGEDLRVRRRELRQQAALVALVVEQHLLVGVARGVELAALVAVRDGDRQRHGRSGGRRAVERDAALHERAEHREEPAAGARDGARVRAVLGHRAVAVQQVLARNAHVREVQPAVVDAVEPALQAVVLAADPLEESALGVAERHVERVHAVVHALGDELGEHHGGGAVQRRVAEVVLPGAAERRVDHELLLRLVVRRGRADRRDIRAVSRLGHGERARDLQRHDVGQERAVVVLGAEVQHRGAEEAPLHARLDLQARVGEHELLERGDVAAVVVVAAELLRERLVHGTLLDEELELAEHALAVLRHGLALDALEVGLRGAITRGDADVGPRAEELAAELLHVDARRRRLGIGARGRDRRCDLVARGLRGHGGGSPARGLRGAAGCRVNHRRFSSFVCAVRLIPR